MPTPGVRVLTLSNSDRCERTVSASAHGLAHLYELLLRVSCAVHAPYDGIEKHVCICRFKVKTNSASRSKRTLTRSRLVDGYPLAHEKTTQDLLAWHEKIRRPMRLQMFLRTIQIHEPSLLSVPVIQLLSTLNLLWWWWCCIEKHVLVALYFQTRHG